MPRRVVLVLPLLVGQAEHKVMAHMQGRLGPMYAGGYHGWAQLVADGVKFVQKEDITPRAADRWVFRLAPAVALIPYLVALAAIPTAPGVAAIDVPGSVVLVLAATSVGALGTLMAGWASANKYALLGGLRAAAQLVSYELPIVLAVASMAAWNSRSASSKSMPAKSGCTCPTAHISHKLAMSTERVSGVTTTGTSSPWASVTASPG